MSAPRVPARLFCCAVLAFAVPAQGNRVEELIALVGADATASGVETVPGRRAAEAGRIRELHALPGHLDARHVPALLVRLRSERNPDVWRICVSAIGMTRSTLADDWILSVATWANGEAIVRDGIRSLARTHPEAELVRSMKHLLETAPSPRARFDALDWWAIHSRATCMAEVLVGEYRAASDPEKRARLVGHMGRCGATELVAFLREEWSRGGDATVRASILRALGRLDRKAARDLATRVVRGAETDEGVRRAAIEELVLQGDREALPFVLAEDATCSLRWWGCAPMRDALDRIPVGDLGQDRGVGEILQREAGQLLRVAWPKETKPEAWMLIRDDLEPRCRSLLDLLEPVQMQFSSVDLVFDFERTGRWPEVPNWEPDWILAWGRTEPEWTIVFGPRSQWLKERAELLEKLRPR